MVVYCRDLSVSVQENTITVRGRSSAENFSDTTVGFLRNRATSQVLRGEFVDFAWEHGELRFALAFRLEHASVARGTWDLALHFDVDGGVEADVPVQGFLCAQESAFFVAQGGLWSVSSSYQPSISLTIEHGDADVLPLSAFEWEEGNVARLSMDATIIPVGFSLQALSVADGQRETQYPVQSENVAGEVAGTFVRIPFSQWVNSGTSLALSWALLDAKGNPAVVRVSAARHARASASWILPSSRIDGTFDAFVPCFQKNDALTIERGCFLQVAATSIDMTRWGPNGEAVLTLTACEANGVYLINPLHDSSLGVDVRVACDDGVRELYSMEKTAKMGEESLCVLRMEAAHFRNKVLCKLVAYVRHGTMVCMLPVVGSKLARPGKFASFKVNAVPHRKDLYRSLFVDKAMQFTLEVRPRKKLETRRRRFVNLAIAAIAQTVAKISKREMWLVGENLGRVAQDNGVAFFEYCCRTKVPENVRYVARANNTHGERLAKNRRQVIRYDSLMHFYYYHRANHLVVAHGVRDVMPTLLHPEMGRNHKSVVYLQHGIVAMKRIGFNNRSYNDKIQAFVVCSDYEKRILQRYNRFDEKRLVVTGLPRSDNLVSSPSAAPTILVMPTWRDWSIGDEDAMTRSAFHREYSRFLSDTRLHSLLSRAGATLLFYPHMEIERRYMHLWNVTSSHVRVLRSADVSVQELLKSSWAMITDYSSVAWDFNYMKKPTVFFQFDRAEYLQRRGSYIDLETELPGPVCNTSDELLEQLEKLVASGFQYEQRFAEKAAKFYRFSDKRNSQRVYNVIRSLGKD